jgi:hypothetical protein
MIEYLLCKNKCCPILIKEENDYFIVEQTNPKLKIKLTKEHIKNLYFHLTNILKEEDLKEENERNSYNS